MEHVEGVDGVVDEDGEVGGGRVLKIVTSIVVTVISSINPSLFDLLVL